jgi:hypothetical protein
VQRHLAGDARKRLHQEVGCAHGCASGGVVRASLS